MSIMSQYETKKRRHGDPVTIHRQVFFQGMVYIIEEEVYSDSDHSSVYTSEDDFQEDNSLQLQFGFKNPLKSNINLQDGSSKLAISIDTASLPRNLRSTANDSK